MDKDLIYWWIRYGIWTWLKDRPRKIKSFFQRGYRGWADEDIWDFDVYLASVIHEGLQHLQKNNSGGHPNKYTKLEWQEKISAMVYAFMLQDQIGKGKREFYSSKFPDKYKKEFKCLTREEDRAMKRGMKIFIKNFNYLWS